MSDPSLEHYLEIHKQEAETQLHKLTLVKTNVLDHVNQFRALVTKTGEMFDESRAD